MILEALAQHLHAEGHGRWLTDPAQVHADGDVALVLEHLPDTPDRVVCLTGYATLAPDGGSDDTRVQLRVRDPDPAAGRARAVALQEHLDGLAGMQLGDVWLVLCAALDGPAYMGADRAGRHEHVVNVQLSTHNPRRRARGSR